jgi:hypothetical protein
MPLAMQVFTVWPFKQLLLRGASGNGGQYKIPPTYLFHFGGTDALRQPLHITNRLTG